MGSFCFVIDERTLLRSNLGVWVDRASGNCLHYRRQKLTTVSEEARRRREKTKTPGQGLLLVYLRHYRRQIERINMKETDGHADCNLSRTRRQKENHQATPTQFCPIATRVFIGTTGFFL